LPAAALELNSADRMREISEIIVCRGHVSVAAMGIQGQAEAMGDPAACPRTLTRGDEPRPAPDATPSTRIGLPEPPMMAIPPIMPTGGGPPPIAPPAIVAPMVVSPPSGGGGFYMVKP